MGEHLKEQPFPLRDWHAGQGVVRSEMVKAHLMVLKQQEATGGLRICTAGSVEGCDVK